jgi:hypothetical protein
MVCGHILRYRQAIQLEHLQAQHRGGLRMISKEEKINLLNNMIDNYNIHINILSNDILNNPNDDIVGKPKRQNVLDEFYEKRNALQYELLSVENN